MRPKSPLVAGSSALLLYRLHFYSDGVYESCIAVAIEMRLFEWMVVQL